MARIIRGRLFSFLSALAVVGLLATPVASAAPGQSSWESGTGIAFDQCTGESFDNVESDFLHALPDGTFMVDQVVIVRVASQGKLPNSWVTVRVHLVFDSDGNVISGTSDVSFGCHSS